MWVDPHRWNVPRCLNHMAMAPGGRVRICIATCNALQRNQHGFVCVETIDGLLFRIDIVYCLAAMQSTELHRPLGT